MELTSNSKRKNQLSGGQGESKNDIYFMNMPHCSAFSYDFSWPYIWKNQ